MANPIRGIQNYFHEVMEEVKKCNWPEKRNLREQTLIEVVTMAILTLFILGVDTVLQEIIKKVVL